MSSPFPKYHTHPTVCYQVICEKRHDRASEIVSSIRTAKPLACAFFDLSLIFMFLSDYYKFMILFLYITNIAKNFIIRHNKGVSMLFQIKSNNLKGITSKYSFIYYVSSKKIASPSLGLKTYIIKTRYIRLSYIFITELPVLR